MAESAHQADPILARQSRILVIDDQADLLRTISLMLNQLGHECVSCSDPIKALDVIDKEHQNIDLLITDYSMPGLSGLEIIDYCAERFPKLPVVLITGYARKISKISKSGKPISHVLHKPFTMSALDEMLNKIL